MNSRNIPSKQQNKVPGGREEEELKRKGGGGRRENKKVKVSEQIMNESGLTQ